MGIAIVGAGGHGRVAYECLELAGALDGDVAFFDDRWETLAAVEGISVYGPVARLVDDERFPSVFVGIGDNGTRRRNTRMLDRAGKRFLTALHPRTVISPRAQIGPGTIVVAGTVVNRDARVGSGAILNTLCSVGHDCVVEDFAQVSPGVNLGGACVIEEGAFLGMGVKVGPEARVGAWSVVGAGSVVLDDLPARSFCIGMPARAVRNLRADELAGADGFSG
jgi:sugar O-acyltransferase (sialic acid O-acetyltransferase NeuD family)